ncbi:MAG TPA: hypothetical protein VHW67_09695 [Solirubrobacteraceae bacterium]|nr:hypothetical protein [Solirubrobacteraceae bacterium]
MLDDAIREHLELKRQRGADPGEVAREQREALSAVPAEGTSQGAAHAAETVSGGPLTDPPIDAPPADAGAGESAPQGRVEPSAAPGEPGVLAGAGETAELDMRTVLGEDAQHEVPSAAASVGGGSGHEVGTDEAPASEDSLEWEMPADATAETVEAADADEDVLEETPDFLRDTPEQERLWFEQRPPRDFDFDK